MRKPQRSCVALMKNCFPKYYETHARAVFRPRAGTRAKERTHALAPGADRCARSRKHDRQPRSAGRNGDNILNTKLASVPPGMRDGIRGSVVCGVNRACGSVWRSRLFLRRGRAVHRTRCVVPMLAVRVHPVNVIPCRRGFTLPAASHERRLSVFLRREPFSRDAKRSSCIGNDCLQQPSARAPGHRAGSAISLYLQLLSRNIDPDVPYRQASSSVALAARIVGFS